MSWSVSSCTSEAANDGVWHSTAARLSAGTEHAEVGFDPRLVVVGAHVLLHFQLDPVPTWSQSWLIKRTLHPERAARQGSRPVAVDVHIASEQRAVVAPNRHDEHR